MTLDELIVALAKADRDLVVAHGFGSPHSYRGDYSEVAFEPAENVTVGSMLDYARSADGKTFTGYKGGEFTMGGWTDCYLAEYGDTGEPITEAWLSIALGTNPELAALRQQLAEVTAAEVFIHAGDGSYMAKCSQVVAEERDRLRALVGRRPDDVEEAYREGFDSGTCYGEHVKLGDASNEWNRSRAKRALEGEGEKT